MRYRSLMSLFEIFMTQEEMKRISAGARDEDVVVDLHGLHKWEALRFIRNIIASCKTSLKLILIHGYNHGTVLKDMIRGDTKISPRVKEVVTCEWNPGMTSLVVV